MKTRTTLIRAGLLAGAIFGLVAATGQGAMVTWGSATDIAANTDVSTTGTLVAAYRFGGTGLASTTVNGVTFLPFVVDGTSNSVTVGGFTLSTADPISSATTSTWQALSTEYTTLLSGAAVLNADDLVTLALTGLSVGATYRFQTWVNNSDVPPDTGGFTYPTTVGDGLGHDVSLYAGDNPGGNPGLSVPGQYVIGTFTADATTQAITYVSGEISGVVNAFQLRQTSSAPPTTNATVPEPGSLLAWAVFAGVAATVARRRRPLRA